MAEADAGAGLPLHDLLCPLVSWARRAQRLPIANQVVRDQFRRASLSVLTNVAEGAGRVAKADKRRCYAIARGEACESAALLELVDDTPVEISELLSRVIAMLTRLVG